MPIISSRLQVFAIFVFFSTILFAQAELPLVSPQQVYNRASIFFQKKQYGLAQIEFERVLMLIKNKNLPLLEEGAQYHILECAYEQQHSNTEVLIVNYLSKFPHAAYFNDAQHLLGKLYYRAKNYEKALSALEKFHSYNLSERDLQEYTFKKAASHFYLKQYEEAMPLFALLKKTDSKYAPASTYYYAHIAYDQKSFSVALQDFESLRDDEVFQRVVPYYVIHIHHYQKNYDKVIEEGEKMIENVSAKRLAEISRIISEAYYHKENYAKALPYIETFTAHASTLTRSDKYIAGYVYYKNNYFGPSIKMFEQIVVGNDSLSQNAYYYLGDAFLKMSDKRNARQAFLQASKMAFFLELKEDAMFNYAKLSFELNISPFNDAIDALNLYLKEYPNSRRKDEVYKCLMQAYLISKNYKDALASLQIIETPDAEVLSALQKIAYFRAIELFQNKEYEESLKLFDLSLKSASYHPQLAALAIYWKGESMYRLKQFAEAKALFSKFVLSAGSVPTKEYKIAHYNLGYSAFQLKEYDEAGKWFRKYLAFADNSNYPMLYDSHNRTADCNFMQARYNEAINSYNNVIKMNAPDADYAAYQAGLCYGLLGELEKKINFMDKVLNLETLSPYSDQALYEKGRSYVQLSQYEFAITAYNHLLTTFPYSPLFSKVLVELGFIAVNQQEYNQALTHYKRVVSDFAGTAEARTALLGIKNIYLETGDIEQYFQYVASLTHIPSMSNSEKDSLSFSVAEKAYLDNNDEKAQTLLDRYLTEFEEGIFAVDAHFYRADCFYRNQQYEEAIPHLAYIIHLPKGNYTEDALQKAVYIANSKQDYEQAITYYDQLEEVASSRAVKFDAQLGLLRNNFILKNYQVVIDNANQLLEAENLPEEIQLEATFKQAKAYEAENDSSEAIDLYRNIINQPTTQEGAEATYRVINYEFNEGNLEKAETLALDFSKTGTPHQYWLAKSFIKLGDIYIKREDSFQAKATYESILDGYKETSDGIIEEASSKLKDLLAIEQKKEDDAQNQDAVPSVSIEP
ncbi:MAG: tetratricopeptide repeat protein [Bacteroidales bacterium]